MSYHIKPIQMPSLILRCVHYKSNLDLCLNSNFRLEFDNHSSDENKLSPCKIDEHGQFKYILIELNDPSLNEKRILMRGSKTCKYHSEIFDDFMSNILYLNI